MSKRVTSTIAAFLFGVSMAWIGGFDFNERGSGAFLTFGIITWLTGFVYFMPPWRD
jgi:hypothetical protein